MKRWTAIAIALATIAGFPVGASRLAAEEPVNDGAQQCQKATTGRGCSCTFRPAGLEASGSQIFSKIAREKTAIYVCKGLKPGSKVQVHLEGKFRVDGGGPPWQYKVTLGLFACNDIHSPGKYQNTTGNAAGPKDNMQASFKIDLTASFSKGLDACIVAVKFQSLDVEPINQPGWEGEQNNPTLTAVEEPNTSNILTVVGVR